MRGINKYRTRNIMYFLQTRKRIPVKKKLTSTRLKPNRVEGNVLHSRLPQLHVMKYIEGKWMAREVAALLLALLSSVSSHGKIIHNSLPSGKKRGRGREKTRSKIRGIWRWINMSWSVMWKSKKKNKPFHGEENILSRFRNEVYRMLIICQ